MEGRGENGRRSTGESMLDKVGFERRQGISLAGVVGEGAPEAEKALPP